MTKRARKDDEEDRPRRYRTALEEIRHELRELWGGPPYDRGDKLPGRVPAVDGGIGGGAVIVCVTAPP